MAGWQWIRSSRPRGCESFASGRRKSVAGTLANMHLLVVPGGGASRQAEAIGPRGREQIQRFVGQGGGYIGICAGAYLCLTGFDWGLKILNGKTVSPRWNRGHGAVKFELTDTGKKILGDRAGLLDVHYANGPGHHAGRGSAVAPLRGVGLFSHGAFGQ